jgi:putrescine aminotransferase
VDRVAELAPYFNAMLKGLEDHPIVGETRSVGLIGALELTRNKATRERFNDSGRVGTICRDHCFANGLIMRACWDTMVLAPPFCISKKEIDEIGRLARTGARQDLCRRQGRKWRDAATIQPSGHGTAAIGSIIASV